MTNIKISPKHGVNPTMPVCFWCGQPTGEVALCGKVNQQDSEMPMYTLLDYEPCSNCRMAMSRGVQLIGYTETQPADKRPPITDTKNGDPALYPDNRFTVMTADGFARLIRSLIDDPDVAEKYIEQGIKMHKMMLPKEVVDHVIKNYEKQFGKIPDKIK